MCHHAPGQTTRPHPSSPCFLAAASPTISISIPIARHSTMHPASLLAISLLLRAAFLASNVNVDGPCHAAAAAAAGHTGTARGNSTAGGRGTGSRQTRRRFSFCRTRCGGGGVTICRHLQKRQPVAVVAAAVAAGAAEPHLAVAEIVATVPILICGATGRGCWCIDHDLRWLTT